jgi:hypothetical protein
MGADRTAGLGIGRERGATSVGTDSHSEGEGAGSAKVAWQQRGFLWTHHESVRRATKEIMTWSVWSLLSFTIVWPSSLPLCANKGMDRVLSVETHQRVATGNTKSREVAGALAGTAPSSTAHNSSAAC